MGDGRKAAAGIHEFLQKNVSPEGQKVAKTLNNI
jgi:hypothetical protein